MFFSRTGAAEISSTMSCFCDKQKCPKENQHFNRLEFPKCLCVWVWWTSNAVIRCGELRSRYSLACEYRMWSKKNCSATNSFGVTRENGVPATNVTRWTNCSGKIRSTNSFHLKERESYPQLRVTGGCCLICHLVWQQLYTHFSQWIPIYVRRSFIKSSVISSVCL